MQMKQMLVRMNEIVTKENETEDDENAVREWNTKRKKCRERMKYMSTQMKQVPWENEMAFNMVHETNEKKLKHFTWGMKENWCNGEWSKCREMKWIHFISFTVADQDGLTANVVATWCRW
jgi:hypothetical protein